AKRWIEPFPRSERCSERVRGRAGERRDREQTDAHDAEGEKRAGKFSSKRRKRLRRVLRSLNMRDSVLMKRERSRENDEEHDQIRKEPADVDINLARDDF